MMVVFEERPREGAEEASSVSEAWRDEEVTAGRAPCSLLIACSLGEELPLQCEPAYFNFLFLFLSS